MHNINCMMSPPGLRFHESWLYHTHPIDFPLWIIYTLYRASQNATCIEESEKSGISSLLSIKNCKFPREIVTYQLPNSKKVDKSRHLIECPLLNPRYYYLFLWKMKTMWTLSWKEIDKRHGHKLKIIPVISWRLTHSFFRIAPRLHTAWLHYQASHQITTLFLLFPFSPSTGKLHFKPLINFQIVHSLCK